MSINTHRVSRTGSAALLAACIAGSVTVAQNAGAQETAAANEAPLTFSGSLEVGGEYNSNVSVTELESAIGESDSAALLDAGIDMNWNPAERLSVDAGYSYSSRSYRDFDEFDLGMHLLYGDLSYELDAVTLGTSYYYADARLGGDDFMTLQQYSLYAGKLLTDQWYLRGAVNFADKSFDDFFARSADGEGVSLDAFYFFNQGRSTLLLSYAFDDESASARQFSYTANTLRLRYTNRFSLLQKESQLQLGVRLQDRDYAGVTPSIGERRDDQQVVTEASFEISLTPSLDLITQLERGNYTSALSSADYSENRASLSLKLSF